MEKFKVEFKVDCNDDGSVFLEQDVRIDEGCVMVKATMLLLEEQATWLIETLKAKGRW